MNVVHAEVFSPGGGKGEHVPECEAVLVCCHVSQAVEMQTLCCLVSVAGQTTEEISYTLTGKNLQRKYYTRSTTLNEGLGKRVEQQK